MKLKMVIFTLILILFNSCVVKSLHPFYTKNTISFEESFLGNWEDNANGNWEVMSFKTEFLKENTKNKTISELSEDDLKMYISYKDSYIINYSKGNTKTVFLAVPFTINNQLFLDFTPIEINGNCMNELAIFHITLSHSLVKFDLTSNNNLSIKWFDEDKIKNLLDSNKIKIKHEKIGLEEQYLLTASSEELQKFIKKYMTSVDDEKWKTSVEFQLERANG